MLSVIIGISNCCVKQDICKKKLKTLVVVFQGKMLVFDASSFPKFPFRADLVQAVALLLIRREFRQFTILDAYNFTVSPG